jgi:hypothetical protein
MSKVKRVFAAARIGNALAIVSLACCGCGAHHTSYDGIAVVKPVDWHIRFFRGAVAAATVPIPADETSLAASVGRKLRSGDVAVVLFEDTPDAQWSPPLDFAVYRAGPPQPFATKDFGGPPFGGDNPGHHRFARRNFTVAGRYFDLFVEAGAQLTAGRITQLNHVIGSLRVRPGDFYPGAADPARFRAAPGWHIRSIGTIPNGTSMMSVTVSSTVPYADPLNAQPPLQTLRRLNRNGIVITVTLEADNRAPPPTHGSTTLKLSPPQACTWGEGPATPGIACAGDTVVVGDEYTAIVTVIYGRPDPPGPQRRRAARELRQLRLPHWIPWR